MLALFGNVKHFVIIHGWKDTVLNTLTFYPAIKKEQLQNLCVSPMLSSINFIILDLTLRSLICFELIFF